MPILLFILLVILIAQVGFWDTFAADSRRRRDARAVRAARDRPGRARRRSAVPLRRCRGAQAARSLRRARGGDLASGRVTVFGGSGFLGRRIALRLAADGALVRIAVRRPERAEALTRAGRPGRSRPSAPTCGTRRRWRPRLRAPRRWSTRSATTSSAAMRASRRSTARAPGTSPRPPVQRASPASCTSRASAPIRPPTRPTCAPAPSGSAWCARRFRPRPSCARASCSGPTTTSSSAWPASRACCRRCRCSAPGTSGCSRCTSTTSLRP